MNTKEAWKYIRNFLLTSEDLKNCSLHKKRRIDASITIMDYYFKGVEKE